MSRMAAPGFNSVDQGYEDQIYAQPYAERTNPSALTEILSVMQRRRMLIAVIVSAMLALGLLYTLLATRKYTASAIIEIQRETGSFDNVAGATKNDSIGDQEFYQTQYGLLQSRALAERVANDLALYSNTEFLKAAGIVDDDATPGASLSAQERRDRIGAAAAYLLKRFEVEPERFSRLVTIKFTGPDPALTKRVVDTWSVDFIRMTLARRYEATSYARTFLEQRLTQLRTRIDEGERQLVAYASRQGIVNLPATGTGGAERSIVADDLASLNTELGRAVADRVRAQSRLSGGGSAVTEALTNPAINTLRSRRAELASDYAKLMVQFEPGYPPARALREQIDQIDRSIGQETGRVQQSLREDYVAAARRESQLESRISQLKSGVLDFRRRSIQYNILQREADTNRQLYDALLQRYKEIGVAGGVGVNNISVVDSAELPTRPSSPKLILNMAVALVLGLGLSAMAAFLLEQIDQGITDPGQVEGSLGLPLLGTIPKLAGQPLDQLADRKTAISEAYLSVQTNLGFATNRGFPPSLAVTSSRAAEGKSTTAFAIAQSLGRTKRRVLLVDGDMRSPSVHRMLGLSNERGFSNYLTGDDDLENLIVGVEGEPISVMTTGPQPPSAPELLSGERFRTLIGELLTRFDHVIFDIPPVMGLADAPLFAGAINGVVFVIESNGTHISMAKVALGRLRAANARIFGTVLTKFDSKRGLFGYGYEYGYGYTYGDDAKARG